MEKKFFRKMLVISIIFLFVGASTASVNIEIKNKEPIKNQSRGPSGNIQLGDPQKDGNFTLYVTFTAKMPGTGTRYTTNVVIKVPINGTDDAVKKANKVRDAINKSGAPLTGEGTSSSVEIKPGKNGLGVNGTRVNDGTQQNQSSYTSWAGYSFEGQPPFSNYPLKLWVNEVYEISVNPEGKTIPIINSEIVTDLLINGYNAMLDPTGLAFYIFNIESTGIQSENDKITPYAAFQLDEIDEPFNVLVGYCPPMTGDPTETVIAHFDIANFRFKPDIYEIIVTDMLGWVLDPVYIQLPIGPWETVTFDLMITIPTYLAPVYNIINVTARSTTEPWYASTGSVQVRVGNNPPSKPNIDGPASGKAGTAYPYTFTSTDTDVDDLSYYIKWGDGTYTDWTAFQASGVSYSGTHTWSTKGTYTIEAKAKDIYGLESDWATLEIKMPRSIMYNMPLLKLFFEKFPNAFPILRHLLRV